MLMQAAVLSVEDGAFETAAVPAAKEQPKYPLLTKLLGVDPTRRNGQQEQWHHWNLDAEERKLAQQMGLNR